MRALIIIGSLICSTFAHAADLKSALQAAVANPNDQQAFAALTSVLPAVTLPNGSTVYVFEGDILRNEEQLLDYLRQLRGDTESVPAANGRNPELIVNKVADKQDFYETLSARQLTYSIDKAKFSPDEFARIQDDLRQATMQWMAKCPTCNISFEYKPQYNSAPSTTQTTFVATKINGGKLLASSFFPSDPPERKLLLIDKSYFDQQSFDRVGILRHEVGHILGYRHEHLSEQAGCKLDPESGQWEALTPYDPLSVMHYFCNGKGTRQLEISQLDERGHRCLYDTSYAAASSKICKPGQAAENARQRIESIAAKLSGSTEATVATASQVTLRNSPALSIRFQGGDIPKNLVQVIDLMIAGGAIKPIDYKVQPGDYVCLLFRQIMDWPAVLKCPNELQSLAAGLNNRSKAQMERIRAGETIKVVPLLSIRSYESRRVCNEACERRGTAWNTYRFSEQKDGETVEEKFLFYELKVPIENRRLLEQLDQTIKEKQIPNLFSEIVDVNNGLPTRPKFNDAANATPANGFLNKCFAGEINHNHRAWYAGFIGKGSLPACALSCVGTGCADVVLLDGGDIYGNPNLKGAIKYPAINYAAASADDPAICKLVSDPGTDKYHATMMAGIIGARPDQFPFVGMAPAAKIAFLDVNRKTDGLIFENIMDYAQQNAIVVTATQFPVLVGGSTPKTVARPENSLINTALVNTKNLVVAAAGQPKNVKPGELFSETTELTRNLNAAPVNIGDHEYVIVVTACSDCSDQNATLWPKANWSDKGLVHLAAPGQEIPVLGDESKFMTAGGTSTATAFVGGVAASMMNCFSGAYNRPWKIKQRLQLTARPVLTGEDNRRVTGGIIDADLALKDPDKIWVKKRDNINYEEINKPAWCVPEIKLTDAFGKGPIAEGNTDTEYVLRLRRMADGTFVVFKQPPWDPDHDKDDYYQAKIMHTLSGVPNFKGNLLSTAKGILQIEEIDDLVFSSRVRATAQCKNGAMSSSD